MSRSSLRLWRMNDVKWTDCEILHDVRRSFFVDGAEAQYQRVLIWQRTHELVEMESVREALPMIPGWNKGQDTSAR